MVESRFQDYLGGRENLHVVAAAREPAAHGRIDAALLLPQPAVRAGCPQNSSAVEFIAQ